MGKESGCVNDRDGSLDVSRPGLAQRHNTAHVRARGDSPSKSGPWDFVMKAAVAVEIARIVIGGSLDVRVELLPCRAVSLSIYDFVKSARALPTARRRLSSEESSPVRYNKHASRTSQK